jgi:hypothetical protein
MTIWAMSAVSALWRCASRFADARAITSGVVPGAGRARESDRQFGAVKATKILLDCLGRADRQSVDLIDARGACLVG